MISSSGQFTHTSISSLYLSRGASIMLRSLNVSVSTSKLWPVTLTQEQIKLVLSSRHEAKRLDYINVHAGDLIELD